MKNLVIALSAMALGAALVGCNSCGKEKAAGCDGKKACTAKTEAVGCDAKKACATKTEAAAKCAAGCTKPCCAKPAAAAKVEAPKADAVKK